MQLLFGEVRKRGGGGVGAHTLEIAVVSCLCRTTTLYDLLHGLLTVFDFNFSSGADRRK